MNFKRDLERQLKFQKELRPVANFFYIINIILLILLIICIFRNYINIILAIIQFLLVKFIYKRIVNAFDASIYELKSEIEEINFEESSSLVEISNR